MPAQAQGGASSELPTPTPDSARLESERCAAEAALAQCVREYAKERAQKVRLQQQIGALQKRLLRTQIDEHSTKLAEIFTGKASKDDLDAMKSSMKGLGDTFAGQLQKQVADMVRNFA